MKRKFTDGQYVLALTGPVSGLHSSTKETNLRNVGCEPGSPGIINELRVMLTGGAFLSVSTHLKCVFLSESSAIRIH